MYVPEAFAEPSTDILFDLIDRHPFGLLIAHNAGRVEAAHVPFALDRDHGANGRLRAHVAKANPIWQMLDGAKQALAVFGGPHAYISPDWYIHDGLLPTWNYTAAHVYGTPTLMDDSQTEALLVDLSAANEAGLAPKPNWTVDRVKPKAWAAALKQIVGIALEIERIEGKAKLGQNRAPEDVKGAAEALRERGSDAERAIADLMQSKLSDGT